MTLPLVEAVAEAVVVRRQQTPYWVPAVVALSSLAG